MPPVAATDHDVGLMTNVGVAPACVTVIVRPAIVAVAIRGKAEVVCGAAVIVTEALPLPVAGTIVNQPSVLEEVHVAPGIELVSEMTCAPPAAVGAHVAGVTPKVASASAAAAIRMRGNVSPLRVSSTGAPVVLSAERMVPTEAVGSR